MGEMRDSDWSRPKILRSDWLGLIGAIMTTQVSVTFAITVLREFTKYHLFYFRLYVVTSSSLKDLFSPSFREVDLASNI